MSFTYGSGTQKHKKEFIFAEPSSRLSAHDIAKEYTELKSDRFERKGHNKKNRRAFDDVVVTHYRDPQETQTQSFPVELKSVEFDLIRRFQNLEAFPYAFEKDLHVLQWICAMAGESPTARILLKEAQADGWNIKLDDLAQAGYAIDEEAHDIVLDHYEFTASALGRSAYFRNALFVSFVKALRQIWHDRQDHSSKDNQSPDALLMLERARAADCETVAILVGWELRGAGYTDIWRSILGAEQGDMAMIFTRAIEKDPAGFYDGSVLTRTFCQWYGDDARVNATDHSVLENMDEMLSVEQGNAIFGKSAIEAPTIEKLSRLPGGRCYLEGMGANIVVDPYFTAVQDPINKAHLGQIIYDSKAVIVEGVPFRDSSLAHKIFPGGLVKA